MSDNDLKQHKHTPGPWHAADRGIGWEVHIGAEHPEEGWCDSINEGFRETFTEADARLIAAAPQMYAALKRAAELLDATTRFMARNPIAAEYMVKYDEAMCDGSCLGDDCLIAFEEATLALMRAEGK